MEAQFVALSMDDVKVMIDFAVEKSATVTAKRVSAEFEKSKRQKKDRRLHNMQLLLKNYRALKAGCENAVYQKTEHISEIMGDIMDMDDSDSVIVESIKRSAERTAIIISHIDVMLDMYYLYCTKQGEKEMRKYDIIKALYIDDNKPSVKELADFFHVSKMTIHNDRRSAIEMLSTLMFGIDGLHMEE